MIEIIKLAIEYPCTAAFLMVVGGLSVAMALAPLASIGKGGE